MSTDNNVNPFHCRCKFFIDLKSCMTQGDNLVNALVCQFCHLLLNFCNFILEN